MLLASVSNSIDIMGFHIRLADFFGDALGNHEHIPGQPSCRLLVELADGRPPATLTLAIYFFRGVFF